MVASLRHQVAKEGYSMVLECIKDSVSKSRGDDNTFPGIEQKLPNIVNLYEEEESRTKNTKTTKPAFLS